MMTPLKYFTLSLFWLVFSTSFVFAKEVVLPLTLDHSLLTSLLRQHSFANDDQSAAVVGRPGDCTYIRLSKPQFSSAEKLLRLELRLDIKVSVPLGETCLLPVEWHGYLELLQQPILDSKTFELSFKTVDSNLFTLSRKPAIIAGFLWKFAKPKVSKHLDQVRLDLAPPVAELRSFLTSLLPDEVQQEPQAMLDSLRGGKVDIGKDAVTIELLAEVKEVFVPEDDEVDVELTPQEREQLIQLWDTWDAFLVRLLTTMATDSLRPEDRQILIDVLLDTRYAFTAALEEQGLEKDFVRVQFVWAWRQLAPVFRRQLYSQPSEKNFGYLAFFTAANALSVFDQLGPTFGIEISQQGLLRLARMLAGKDTTLPYGPQLDQKLRELLQLPPIDEEVEPLDNIKEIDAPDEEPEADPFVRISDFFFKPVYGAELPDIAEILRWKAPGEDVDEYVARVRAVLIESSDKVFSRGEIPDEFEERFHELILAMAWQESCFRQFVTKNKKLTYLLSYNQTSVGLMQINERVWRGMYDRNRLRWDIRYNALAGCEIAELYLRKYALNHSVWKKNDNSNLLSQVVYAMYNGGPTQYKKFLDRERAARLYQSDKLFLEKLQWVKDKKWQQINDCLIGS